MGYAIAAVLLILAIVWFIRLVVHVVSLIGAWLASVVHAIGHGLLALTGFLATVAPTVAAVMVAVAVLWGACWLAAELWYARRDARSERLWFEAVAPQIRVAMAPGSSFQVAELGVPPRSAAFGRGDGHPLTLPLPRSVQRLIDAVTEDPAPEAETREDQPRDTPKNTSEDTGSAQGDDLSAMPALAQLDMVRELLNRARWEPVAMLAIPEAVAAPDPTWSPAPPMARPSRDDLADEPRIGRTVFDTDRGVQYGAHNRQYNVYTYEFETPKIEDLASLLSDKKIADAARRLGENPDDATARRDLLNKLAPGGLRFGRPTSRLQVTALRAHTTSSGSWLDGLVLFRDVSGVQVGDHNTQHNEFEYVVVWPSVPARELVAGNRDLARALIDCAFPVGKRRDDATLRAELRSALERLSVQPPGRLAQGARYEYPDPGTTLWVRDHDGVSVGRGSISTYREVKDVPLPSRIREVEWDRVFPALNRADRHDDLDDAVSDRAVSRELRGPGALW